ncbi:MerR family DNA-binding transcriptional regulator [Peribacillus sp. NPDC060186]
MAKLRGMTAETLRHYDRIDLFKPQYIDPHSGYRY